MLITPIFTVIGIFSVPFWMYLSTTPPTPPTPKGRRLRNDFSMLMTGSIRLLQYFLWLHAVAESLSTLSSAGIVSSRTSLLLPDGQSVYLSPTRAIFGLAVVTGAILRWRCFHEMGAHFTFHVTLLKEHKLITSGPYAYIRHPSYLGSLLIDFCLWPWLFLPGSWITESSIAGSIWFWLVLVPCLMPLVVTIPIIFQRCKLEDEILRKQFGSEWEKWAEDVPYKLFPGLY